MAQIDYMPKKKRKKYSFLAEQKRIKNKKLTRLFQALEEDRDLANAFLDEYTPKFPQLYRQFQTQLEARVPGCIYILLDKQKATEKGIPVHIDFVSKTSLEEMFENYRQHPGVENVLDYISAWSEERQLVPVAINIGYWIQGTSFPVPTSLEIIDSEPVPLTFESGESAKNPNSH